MIVSFDPTNDAQRAVAASIIQMMDGNQPAPATVTEQTAAVQPEIANGHDPDPAPVMDATAGVELDKNGTPWLEAVHSGNRKMTAKGVWQKKRGVDDAVLKQAEEAARAKIAGTPEPAPQEQLQQPAAVAPEAAPVVTMEAMGQAWTAAMGAGVVTPDQAPAIYQQLGIDPAQFSTNETARATFVNYLNGLMQPAPAATGIPGIG